MSSANLSGNGKFKGKGCAMIAAFMLWKELASIRSTLAPIPPSSAGAPMMVVCNIQHLKIEKYHAFYNY